MAAVSSAFIPINPVLLRSFLYSPGIRIYELGIRVASLWNEKAKKFIEGRKSLFTEIKSALKPAEYRVWFHCSSVGEFEQARPVIERYRDKFSAHKVVLTFFSPSGFELRKNYSGADYIFYLPVDTRKNAQQFLDLIKPRLVVFVKYDLWWNFLDEVFERKIPAILISAIFRKDSWLFHWYGKLFLNKLKGFNHIFLQDKKSFELLQANGIENLSIAGDTRFDRVAAIASNPKKLPVLESFKSQQNLFVAGSTWPEDERMIFDFMKTVPAGWKFIIVPHEMEANHLKQLKKMSDEIIFYSESATGTIFPQRILVINQIGFLSSVYQYAKVAYIGGGFGRGIHNILEAAVYGVPVIFGPNFSKFNEANDLIACQGGFSIRTSAELRKTFDFILSNYNEVSESCKNYVQQKAGATNAIMTWISAQVQSGAATGG